MWYKTSNGELNKPAAIDTTSSAVYAYIRKDFVQIPASGEEGHEIPDHWEWMEQKIPKEMFGVYRQTQANIEYIAMMTDVDLEEV